MVAFMLVYIYFSFFLPSFLSQSFSLPVNVSACVCKFFRCVHLFRRLTRRHQLLQSLIRSFFSYFSGHMSLARSVCKKHTQTDWETTRQVRVKKLHSCDLPGHFYIYVSECVCEWVCVWLCLTHANETLAARYSTFSRVSHHLEQFFRLFLSFTTSHRVFSYKLFYSLSLFHLVNSNALPAMDFRQSNIQRDWKYLVHHTFDRWKTWRQLQVNHSPWFVRSQVIQLIKFIGKKVNINFYFFTLARELFY